MTTPIMVQYKTIKDQHADCILLFRLGDFYELFQEDAKVASVALDLVLTCRGKGSSEEIPMCGFPVHASETYIARLIKKGFRVAICEQIESSEKENKAPKSAKKLLNREVVRIITPGTLTEDSLLEARHHNFLMALYPHDETVGIASIDISTGAFFIESHGLSSLSAVLGRLQPQEILVPDSFLEHLEESSYWNDWKRKIHPLPVARFDGGEARLTSFYQMATLKGLGNFSACELAAAGGVLDYVLLTQKRSALALSRPRKLDRTNFLEMDAFTRRNLELLQTFSGEKSGALLTSLNWTVTSMGARLFFLRLTHPLRQVAPLLERLDSVAFFVHQKEKRTILREILKTLPDLERALSRILMGRWSPLDLGILRTTLKRLPALCALFSADDPLPSEFFGMLFSVPQSLADRLESALNEELPAFLKDGNVIAKGHCPLLDAARSFRDQGETLIQALQVKYAQETHLSSLKIRRNAIIGYYIEVSPSIASKVPFHFILRQSLVSGARYTTAELMELEQNLLSASDEVLQKEKHLVESLIQEIIAHTEPLRGIVQTLSLLDVSSALAELAVQSQYIRPVLDDSKTFRITGGRHPVVERLQSVPFVKNNCILHEEETCWLLTGPNMAGKSTFLRQNALIALMAHMGSFVPASSAHIGIVDRIFSRVGASDDLARGYSTFMVEMIETASILNQATDKSLVILDEVGRGTATYDGLSLAWACIEHLLEPLQCRTLFATHYHELAALSGLKGLAFYTLKVKEWEKNIVFLHEIVPGVADRSYGLHVARLAGIPESVLHRAETILKSLEAPGKKAQ